MSVSLALSSAASAQAAQASAEAREAKVTACRASVKGYQHNTATVQDMQQYAECVALLHPQVMTGGEMVLVKVAICVTLIGSAIGAYAASKDSGGQIKDGLIGGAIGLFLGGSTAALIALTLYGVYQGIAFLFS